LFTRARSSKAQVVTGFIAQEEEEEEAQKLGYKFSGADAPNSENDHYGLRYAELNIVLIKPTERLSKQNK
jgi:hypothetical protein